MTNTPPSHVGTPCHSRPPAWLDAELRPSHYPFLLQADCQPGWSDGLNSIRGFSAGLPCYRLFRYVFAKAETVDGGGRTRAPGLSQCWMPPGCPLPPLCLPSLTHRNASLPPPSPLLCSPLPRPPCPPPLAPLPLFLLHHRRYYWFIISAQFVAVAGLIVAVVAGHYPKMRQSFLGLFAIVSLLYIQVGGGGWGGKGVVVGAGQAVHAVRVEWSGKRGEGHSAARQEVQHVCMCMCVVVCVRVCGLACPCTYACTHVC